MKKALITLILLFSVSALNAENYWTLVAQLGSTPSSFAFNSNDVMYSGTLGSGIYRSTNYGNSWTQLNNGLTDMYIYSMVINSAGMIFAGSGSHGVYISSNNGSSWIHTSLNVSAKVKAIAVNSTGFVFAGTNGSGIYRSTDNGNTWTPVSSPLNVYDISYDLGDRIFAAAGSPNEGVYRSLDNGLTWQQVFTAEHNFNSIAVNYAGTIFAATGDLNTTDLMGDILARSKDGGETWEIPYTFGTSSYGLVINSLGHLFLGRYRSVWVSTNKGEAWDIKAAGLQTGFGILISYGVNSQGYVFAGQEGGYVYRTNYSTIGITKLGENIPVSYSLHQNYPNPFNPVTNIKFEIPLLRGVPARLRNGQEGRGVPIKLIIYDILGKEVEVLINKEMSPGTYEAEWDASGYSSGVYFYTLSTESFSQTRKMVLIK